jgi:hypothetical protein
LNEIWPLSRRKKRRAPAVRRRTNVTNEPSCEYRDFSSLCLIAVLTVSTTPLANARELRGRTASESKPRAKPNSHRHPRREFAVFAKQMSPIFPSSILSLFIRYIYACSSSQFVKDHSLSGKKSAIHIIVKAIDISFALVKHFLGTYPITVINCDVALVDVLIASLEKESPAEMRTVHMQMNRVWDQPGGEVGLDMSFGCDLTCLWILHREQPKPERTFELE